MDFEKVCLEKGYSKEDFVLIDKAREYSEKMLSSKKRLNGESYFSYATKIANYLIESKFSKDVVIAGFLYGAESIVSKEDLKKEFSSEIAELVFEQLKFKEIRERSKFVSADLLRQIFFTTLKDIRVIFVKLASKLVSLETLEPFSEDEKEKIAKDALEIYAPLAGRLGAEKLKRQITNVSFRIINPKKYSEIEKFLKESERERQEYLDKVIADFKRLLGNRIVKIKGRQKEIYSIYKKMTELKKPLEKQRDHLATRIIVDKVSDCYDCLGILHENYRVIPGTLKDYISSPKENGYKSIHTCLGFDDGKIIEVQIRTIEMDEEAEEGAAAHWSYKKINSSANFEKKTAWLKEIFELSQESNGEDFLEILKVNLFEDKIYCYTPKGDVKELPKGATILDFAYSIHGKVGDSAIGGRINGNFTSLKTKVNSGDVIEIVTSKFQRPRRAWLKFVITHRAKVDIKRGVKKYDNLKVVKSFSVVSEKKSDFEDLVSNEDFPNHKYDLAKCCNPLPRDEIVGVVKSYKKILVHRADCDRIGASSKSQINVDWKETFNRPIKIKLRVVDRSGVLSDILNTVSRGGFVIKEANIKLVDNNNAECFLVVFPRRIDEVEQLIERIQKIRGILKIWFE